MRSLAILLGCILPCAAAAMEPVRVGPDARSFVLTPSGKPFTPWGFNYGHHDQLLEDFWVTDWPAVERDFRAMRALGANVVRVHLQLPAFMDGPAQANAAALDRLGSLLELAERVGLYFDLTGLACYRPADVPPWYDDLDEAGRWAVQANFWAAIARRCAASPAIFCYDLMNEPVVAGEKRKPGQWYSGKPFGGFDYIQCVTLDPAGRPREDVAVAWVKTLTAGVRRHDDRHMVTVGLLPWVKGWGYLSGFVPEKVAPVVDFVAVHVYPEAGKPDEAVAVTRRFAVGKPVVVEETFPLTCSAAELRQYLLASRGIASGWVGHYFGEDLDQTRARAARDKDLKSSLLLEWLLLFKEVGPEMARP